MSNFLSREPSGGASGCKLTSIKGLDLHIGRSWLFYRALQLDLRWGKVANDSFHFQKLANKKLAGKRALINVENKGDDHCLQWSVLAALHPVGKNAERVTKYKPYLKELKMGNIASPVKVKDISQFEKQNNMCVWV